MTNVVQLRKEAEKDPSLGRLHIPAPMEARDDRSPLLQHLSKIAGDDEVQAVIQLLHDIRRFQDHPEMLKAFTEHDHALAHGAKNHGKDILELLVEDYLSHNNLNEGDESMELHKVELELHVKHIALNTLKGYQEVVEGIRGEVSEIADKLKEDESITHVRELIGSIRTMAADEVPPQNIESLRVADDVHHVVYGKADDPHQAMAEVALQKGHRTHEDASRYIKDELHDELKEHHVDMRAASRLEKKDSDVFVKDLVYEKIQISRRDDKRVNAAFSLLEGIREKLGTDSEKVLAVQDSLPEGLFKILNDPAEEDVEELVIKGTSSVSDQLKELASSVESLTELYIAAQGKENFKVRTGLLKLAQAKEFGDSPRGRKMKEPILEGCHELRAILEDDADMVPALTKLWLRNDYGNIERLDELIDKVSTDAQSYLDSDPPPAVVPFSPAESGERAKLLRKLRRPAFDSSADKLCRVLKAALANRGTDSSIALALDKNYELNQMLSWFEAQGSTYQDAIVEAYFDQKNWKGESMGSFGDYVSELLRRVEDNCDKELFDELLNWSSRETMRAAPAPPSTRSALKTMPMVFAKQIVPRINVEENAPVEEIDFDEASLTPEKAPFVSENDRLTVNSGNLKQVAYAMAGSTIEVEDGAKLDLFMANDNVTVQLKGDHSFAKIDRVTRNCTGIRIIGKNGEALTDGPNLELGEDVLKKLSL